MDNLTNCTVRVVYCNEKVMTRYRMPSWCYAPLRTCIRVLMKEKLRVMDNEKHDAYR